MKLKTAFALLVATMAIDSRFDVVASSSSILDGSDPQATRKTRVLKPKNANSCQQQQTMIVGLESEVIGLEREVVGLEREVVGLEREVVGLEREVETCKSSLNDDGGYGGTKCTDRGVDAYATGSKLPCCDGKEAEKKPCPPPNYSCFFCPNFCSSNCDAPSDCFDTVDCGGCSFCQFSDHSATVKKLTESYFKNDKFWFTVPDGRRFMRTYEDQDVGDAYDNAMAVQFMIRQDESTVDRGKDILYAFANEMYCDMKKKPDDGWRGKEKTASKQWVQLFHQMINTDGKWEGPYVTGNNIFVALAFAHASTHLANDENAACYALAAYDIADAIWETRKCELHDFPKDNDSGVNTESMADWHGLLNTLNQDGEYETQVRGMVEFWDKAFNYNYTDPSYYQSMQCIDPLSGTDKWYDYAQPADTTYWSSMADVELSYGKVSENMILAMKNVFYEVDVVDELSDISKYQGFKYNGFKFSSRGNHIQWELTASAGAMPMMHALMYHTRQMLSEGLDDIFESRKTAYIDSIIHLIETSGYVPGSVQIGGSYQTPEIGQQWTYRSVAHTAASAWSGLALLMDGAADKKAFNPFAAQKDMMSRKDAQDKCTNIKQTLAKCKPE